MTVVAKAIELLHRKKQIILQGPPGTGKTHTAMDVAYELIFGESVSPNPAKREKQLEDLDDSDQFKLVQFHPAYTYEDFVRGITAKNNDGVVEYKTENKVLADFAQKALRNFEDSIKPDEEFSTEKWVDEQLVLYVEVVKEHLMANEKYHLDNSDYYVKQVDQDSFVFYCKEWSGKGTGFYFSFSKLIQMYKNMDWENIDNQKPEKNTKSDIKRSIVIDFKNWLEENGSYVLQESPDQNIYVLVIDEINRANLSSVLGELVYALENRGKPIDCMYELDGNRSLILPKNLYIIGTMNTADRSVGYIDYAIRRRFAFLDVLPQDSLIKDKDAKELFNNVSALFTEGSCLSPDFLSHEVQIGHSYFFSNHEDFDLSLALEHEIRPILNQYLKDGILLEPAKKQIEALSV